MSPGQLLVLFADGTIHPPPVPSIHPFRLPLYQLAGSRPCDAPVTSFHRPTRRILSEISASLRCGLEPFSNVGHRSEP